MNTSDLSIELKRILVPVDFSRASQDGLRYAAMVAEKFGAKLDLLYIVEPPSYPDWGYAHLVIRDMKLRRAATEKLPQFAQQCGINPGLLESADVSVGDADSEIVKAARDQKTDLILIASRGMGTLKHTLLGSTTEQVVRHAPCPVLAVRQQVLRKTVPTISTLQLKRILVPTDFSAASKKAFPYAGALALQFEAALILAYVVPSTLPAEFSHIGMVIEEKRLIAEARKQLPKFRDNELPANLQVETHVLNGGPAHEITKAAEELDCDLIVIATHGHTGLKHFWLGSVAERVVRHAPSPVLVVREREREFIGL